eukprot:CAMPEP_0174315978 /NCGR_PEP_ID=MMETSP0810-20121108/6628_1 /TAXON_ID=73025 ORGANISM="Eutreptiella gymnastica-like, Strain CCMP1594" /NCGR_SAMPLE_ID=MMETSP0810 /ASSEMBLY_ACC=CAM_ASM_000659 /LENGTH=141 /DNA_ID=CAMNT_0015425507 /DNA_START=131 /DNA_END=556 /DNA_ORIENTATION=+
MALLPTVQGIFCQSQSEVSSRRVKDYGKTMDPPEQRPWGPFAVAAPEATVSACSHPALTATYLLTLSLPSSRTPSLTSSVSSHSPTDIYALITASEQTHCELSNTSDKNHCYVHTYTTVLDPCTQSLVSFVVGCQGDGEEW